ncbi:MAG: DegV family protein, partial [Clostridia bacterium]
MPEERKTVIVTDSSCDLSDEQLAQYGVRMISLRVVCQNAEYRDRIDIQEDELYELLKKELPKTSLPLPEDVNDLYEQLASQQVTDVIHISISAGLSGTFNMVRMITEDFKDRMNIHIVDSKTLSTGLGMMVLEAGRALERGATPEAAIEAALTLRKTQLGMFVIRTLEFLRKGGRIGMVEGVVGSLLQIKPIIYVNNEGVYQTLAKSRGYKGAVDTMVNEAKRFFGTAQINLSVVNGQAHEDAEAL